MNFWLPKWKGGQGGISQEVGINIHTGQYIKTDNHINLFGHVHKLCMVKPFGLNVGMDCHNFYPIDMETVLFYHNAILRYYDNDVFK